MLIPKLWVGDPSVGWGDNKTKMDLGGVQPRYDLAEVGRERGERFPHAQVSDLTA